MRRTLIYEIKSGKEGRDNFRALWNRKENRFYWNQAKFSNDDPGTEVFVINRHDQKGLFCRIEEKNISAEYKAEEDTTWVYHQYKTYEVKGEWDDFLCMSVEEEVDIPESWNWTRQLGQAETYILWEGPKTTTPEKRLEKIEDLKKLFNADSKGWGVLDEAAQNLTFMQNDMPVGTQSNKRRGTIQGLVATDSNDWKDRHSEALSNERWNYSVFWWDKRPSGGEETLSALRERINEDGAFQFLIADQRQVKYELEIVDFALDKEEYERKNWFGLNEDVYDWREDFDAYGASEGRPTRIIFLCSSIKKLSSPYSVHKLTYFESFKPPTQNNLQPFVEKTEKVLKTELEPKGLIRYITAYMQSKGFYFKEAEVANFYLSLRAKPFVILAGISGTGKTKLATLFIEALGYKDNCRLIPVRPDWTDNSDLVGYTDLQGQFQAKALLRVAKEAAERPVEPFFFVLDEMNLARVEYYFSDFLSHIESRERDDAGRIWTQPLLGPDAKEGMDSPTPYTDLRLPDNLYVIGTVNMDETTHPFSRKVLDRANSIEMNEVDLGWKDTGANVEDPLEDVYNDFLKAPYLNSKDITQAEKSELGDFIEKLQRINQCLEPADLHFAYRVRDEMAFYLLLNKRYQLLSEDEAFDFQLMQKVLPRIQGSSAAVKHALLDLLKELEGIVLSSDEFNQSNLETKVSQVKDPRYPRSLRKIVFMLKRYDNDGFTSFWQ